jgi:hypothetical protein
MDKINLLKSFINGDIDNDFYEQALDEIENNKKDRGVWAKSLALSEGDEYKAKSKYIQLRAADLQNQDELTKESEDTLIIEEQEREYELINHEKFENAINSATSAVGIVVGIYMFLGFSAIGLFTLSLLVGFEPSSLFLLFGGIVLISPYFIIKQLAKKPISTFKERKSRINLMFILTIMSSIALTLIGVIIATFLIYKWVVFNKKSQYRLKGKSNN